MSSPLPLLLLLAALGFEGKRGSAGGSQGSWAEDMVLVLAADNELLDVFWANEKFQDYYRGQDLDLHHHDVPAKVETRRHPSENCIHGWLFDLTVAYQKVTFSSQQHDLLYSIVVNMVLMLVFVVIVIILTSLHIIVDYSHEVLGVL
ncbi:unnamed protein product [Sphagnum jensenii]|uniref:Uncharacterized protein n=1 Tax=Sphagnum jensenii TaxID=128206 RepID=A0ABP1B372_9BRYO